MRLVSYMDPSGRPAPGADLPDVGVVDLSRVLDAHGVAAPSTVADVFRRGQDYQESVRRVLADVAGDDRQAEARGWVVPPPVALLAPLGERVLIVAAGTNYRSHVEEMGEEPPKKPAWFIKSSNSVIGTGAPVRIPRAAPDMVDFEGEFCVVFGRTCHAVTAADAMDYIGGYTIINDVSARDAFIAIGKATTPEEGRWAWTDMLLGKQFPTFCPMGPVVVTADEIADPADLTITTTLNGRLMQKGHTSDLLVGIPQLIEQMSRYFTFEPGDVLSTGTPAGVGMGRKPPVFMRAGDEVRVAIEGIGELVNTITGP
ncbi:2-keto-4-pentenoate hydratase/2-oxohepta-3-ene-1,7-dioic acid hydratase (catechol pathway) [Sinosporangium album]|uniref:2-keto-4-pentenoate hydratase/2-oxohepta-3-ene-1,7-dioic acid hydratase (Catechol pathway) n=1 Tax=Sinosporangium album TaxID=504805 RepID=A0A1G7YPF6_9ACTN|nr:fumarylacetoacetate hydrolase family protein [Sinosporangium album]SDG98284.1 2-keto-4-pentenoate hydratase/2-oxohepta-3-ene-1,7-dioic acid hydratase (catechol pathway) [Sinosporangium album]